MVKKPKQITIVAEKTAMSGYTVTQDLFEQIGPNGDDLEVKIQISRHGIGICAENLGTCGEGSYLQGASPIWIENQEGNLIVYVWSDINSEDYTHRIDMKDALESLWREP